MDADSGAKGSTFRSRARASFSSSTTLAPPPSCFTHQFLFAFFFGPLCTYETDKFTTFSVDVDDALCVWYAIISRGNLYEIIYSVAYTDWFSFFWFKNEHEQCETCSFRADVIYSSFLFLIRRLNRPTLLWEQSSYLKLSQRKGATVNPNGRICL